MIGIRNRMYIIIVCSGCVIRILSNCSLIIIWYNINNFSINIV